jgi:hypothetical protein
MIGLLPVIDDEYASTLSDFLEPLNVAMCEAAKTLAVNLIEQTVVEIDVLVACLLGLVITVLALPGTLAEGESGSGIAVLAWGSDLPISDPATLLQPQLGTPSSVCK